MTPVRPLDDDTYPDGGNRGPEGQTKPSEDAPDKGIRENQMQQHLAEIANSAAQTARYGSHPITSYRPSRTEYTPTADDQQKGED